MPKWSGVPSNKKPNVEPYEDDEDLSEPVPRIEDASGKDKEVNQNPHCDRLARDEVALQCDNLVQSGNVKGRTISPKDSAIGTRHDNHIFSTLVRYVDFEDGNARGHMANMSA